MAISAGQVFVDLGARLDRSEFERYEKHLKDVQQRVAHKERFKAELGANYNERAFRSYQRDLDRAERHTNDMVKANGRLRTSFGSIWSGGGAAFAAAGGAAAIVAGVKSVVGAYGDAEASAKRVATAVDNAGISYKAHREEIDRVIAAQSKLSAFDDEDLADSFARFVTQTKSVNEALKLNALAADVARGRQISLDAAQRLVARGSLGNATALKRLGIEIEPVTRATDRLKSSHDKVTVAQQKAAKEADKQATSQRVIAALQRQFGGQAEQYGRTQQGALERVGVAWENLRETLGAKLAPTITRAANGLARFIDQMSSGEGAGGRFANGLGRVAKVASGAVGLFNGFARAVRVGFAGVLDVLDTAYGAVSTLFSALSRVPGMKWAKDVARDIDTSREKLRAFKKDLDVGVAARDVEGQIARMRRRTHASLSDIVSDTRSNMRTIRIRLGNDSKAGTQALENNYDAAVAAIRRAMRRGTVSTRSGLAEIRRLMLQELRTLGISNAQAQGKPLTNDPAAANRAQRYMGGWLGGRGLVGHDTIPAMLAPGEAVLNRHQQAVIEDMLGDGFLDRLFAQVNRPHFMDRGGRIPFAAGGLAPAVSSFANRLARQFGLSITSTTGGTHAAGSYHYQGLAADLGGAPVAMHRASEWIKSSGAYKSLLEGIHNPNLAVKNGQMVSPSFYSGVWANHANHIHVALRALGAIAGGAGGGGGWENIRTPRTALTGMLGDVVQGTLNRTARLANRRGSSLAASMGGGDVTGQGLTTAGGQFSKAQLAALWRRAGGPANVANLMAAIALAESGGNPRAHNPSGATGLWQILGNPFPGNAYDPLTNARMAVAKYRSQGLGAWEAYTRGMHKRFLSRGGFLNFARGGKASKLAKTVGGATAGLIRKIRPLQTDRSERFERLMGHVEAWDQDYGRWERRFNVTDEELVDADTGQVNVNAVKRKAHELARLIAIRHRIEDELEKARVVVKNIIHSYRRVITSLRRSLRHAKRKDRKGIESYVNQYEGRVNEWQGKLGEVGDSLFDTRTDLMELRAERKEVLATTAEVRDTGGDFGSDTGGGDIGGDIGADTATPDTTETQAAPTPLQIAEAAAAEMRTFLTGRQELLTSFGRNFVTSAAAGGVFGAPDALTGAAGLRAFGGASGGGGLGGATIINNYHQIPDSTHTWSEQMRFIVGG